MLDTFRAEVHPNVIASARGAPACYVALADEAGTLLPLEDLSNRRARA